MTELIPREVLFGNPERARPSISPDGSRLGWIAPKDGVLNVWAAGDREWGAKMHDDLLDAVGYVTAQGS